MNYRAIARRELEAMGAFRSPWLRAAFDAVDREAFVPDAFWGYDTDDRGRHVVIDRTVDEDAWRRAVWNTHRSLITQMNDGDTAEQGPVAGDFSSSISALDIVFEKLNRLAVEPGHRVLHIGTASGYDSALLSEGVGIGSGHLTTVEFDPVLAAVGAKNLRGAGYTPTTVCGDGLEGWAATAPYDRVISTAAVRSIPRQWREQCNDGAVVLAPFNTLYARGGLLRLRVRGRVASGQFVGGACYMWVRSHRPVHRLAPPDDSRKAASPIDPTEVLGRDWAQDFALGLYLPDVSLSHRGEGEDKRVQLWDGTGTSVAIVDYDEWWRGDAVTVYGDRDLWNEVVDAYSAWRLAGQPHYTRFGLTCDEEGEHFWLDHPAARLPGRRGVAKAVEG
ncbi:methyltransferase [Streptomyces sp. Je 1-369]|uniref:methyltransferase n=1 Tax=Streptomyces sp. Je 1-369 TaxID=2966192 RepID=UPI002285792B|nr:methyltransferase [Streptomyces sp. Je 1-369]WAL95922.1 methyltransferase [Streptomyces sp. Je 1-369]